MFPKYTIGQVDQLRSKIKEMIQAVTYRLMSHKNDWRSTRDVMIWDIDGTKFEFLIRSTGMEHLLNTTPPLKSNILSATLFLSPMPFSFSIQYEDLHKDIDEVLTPALLETLTDKFINVLKQSMANRWLSDHGYITELTKMINENRFDDISGYLGIELKTGWDEEGFSVILHDDQSNTVYYDVVHIKGHYLAKFYNERCVSSAVYALIYAAQHQLAFTEELTETLIKEIK
ncbi:hypothetical protein D5W64_13340 [Salmonella enterica subsp. enterica serovar Saintpaul]|nr:hypothetical protein [Salmonella enterica subsp. enterica serovar Saintpaul]